MHLLRPLITHNYLITTGVKKTKNTFTTLVEFPIISLLGLSNSVTQIRNSRSIALTNHQQNTDKTKILLFSVYLN